MGWDRRLQHQRGPVRVNSSSQPISKYFNDIALDVLRVFVIGREYMQIGYKEKALIDILQAYPVIDCPHQVTDMARSGGAMTGEDAPFGRLYGIVHAASFKNLVTGITILKISDENQVQ
jgi:hypothetical protein